MTTLVGGTQGFLDGTASIAQFEMSIQSVIDTSGNIFVSDRNNFRIRRVDWFTRNVTTVAGNGVGKELDGVGSSAQFNGPMGLIISNGSIWVADTPGGTVRHIGMMNIRFKYYTFLNQ